MVFFWIRDHVVERLNMSLSRLKETAIFPNEINQVIADEETADGVFFVLTDGQELFSVLLEEGDRFCFRFEETDREILVPKLDVLGKPN